MTVVKSVFRHFDLRHTNLSFRARAKRLCCYFTGWSFILRIFDELLVMMYRIYSTCNGYARTNCTRHQQLYGFVNAHVGQGFSRHLAVLVGGELHLQHSSVWNIERDRNLGGRHGFTSPWIQECQIILPLLRHPKIWSAPRQFPMNQHILQRDIHSRAGRSSCEKTVSHPCATPSRALHHSFTLSPSHPARHLLLIVQTSPADRAPYPPRCTAHRCGAWC